MSISIGTSVLKGSPAARQATMQAKSQWTELNNRAQALQLSDAGDLGAAERMHLQAINLKETHIGANHITTAVSYNAVGELYIKMNSLDAAEKYLKKALEIRAASPDVAFEAAVTRDNLARVYEMRGNLLKARDIRKSGPSSTAACSNDKCTATSTFPVAQLSHCSVCKSILYCSKKCQTQDWKRHKKFCQPVAV